MRNRSRRMETTQPTSFEPMALSLENPAVPLTDERAWDYMTGEIFTSDSGTTVTPRTALMVPAFWQAVFMISSDVARLPLYLYRKNGRERSRIEDDPADIVCSKVANEQQHAFHFWHQILATCLIHSEAFAYIARDDMGVRSLLPFAPGTVKVSRIKDQRVYEAKVTTRTGGYQWIVLDPYEVFHLRGLQYGDQAACLFKYAKDALGLALAQTKYAGKFFASGGRIGGILQLDAGTPKERRDVIEKTFRETYEDVEQSFKTVVLRDGAKFLPGQQSPEAAQMVEARREAVRDVARIFNLAPSKLGEESGGGYNSKAEDNRDYLDRTLSFWLTTICAEANLKLLDRSRYVSGALYFEHNTKALEWMDVSKRYAAYLIGRQGMWLSPNDIRAKENEPLIEGGDSYDNPNTSSPVATQQPDATMDAHRRLVQHTLVQVFGVAIGKVVRASKKPTFVEALTNGDLLSILDTAADACVPVLEAFESVGGPRATHARMAILVDAHNAIKPTLDKLVDVCSADTIEEAVASALASWLDQFAGEMVGKL